MESNDEPLRPTLNLKSDETSKWKKIAFIFIIISIVLLITLIIISILGFKNKDDDDDKKPEWAPAGDKIKTKWGQNLNTKKVWQEYPTMVLFNYTSR